MNLMVAPPFTYTSSYSPASFGRELRRSQPATPPDNKPGKPDWLLIMMIVLLMIAFSIAWFAVSAR